MKQTFSFLVLLTLTTSLPARTITLTAEDCDQMACIINTAPRLSWNGLNHVTHIYEVASQLQLKTGMAILMRFPLNQIPKDQRILKAELTAPAIYVAGLPKIQVRRLLADWGTGVCHDYSRTYPKKVEWSQPGGRGASDRAPKDSAIIAFKAVGEQTVEVTEDVDLWHTGGAFNRGWILTLENDAGLTYLASPYYPHAPTAKQWKLVITYEPK
jgi:hypothetical protein